MSRVAAVGAAPREVDVQTTRATPAQLREAIATAYTRLTGRAPTAKALDAISAQAMVETGRGTSMVNYNFGGIKGSSPQGMTTKARTVEVEDGKLVHVRDHFRAYATLEDGATDYVKLLRDRFPAAFSRANVGDIDGFAHELKQAHYFTASETDYAKALHAQAGTSSHASPAVASAPRVGPSETSSADRFARAEQISRVLDALSASATRILGDDDDR